MSPERRITEPETASDASCQRAGYSGCTARRNDLRAELGGRADAVLELAVVLGLVVVTP
jgi:hypothetical protein